MSNSKVDICVMRLDAVQLISNYVHVSLSSNELSLPDSDAFGQSVAMSGLFDP